MIGRQVERSRRLAPAKSAPVAMAALTLALSCVPTRSTATSPPVPSSSSASAAVSVASGTDDVGAAAEADLAQSTGDDEADSAAAETGAALQQREAGPRPRDESSLVTNQRCGPGGRGRIVLPNYVEVRANRDRTRPGVYEAAGLRFELVPAGCWSTGGVVKYEAWCKATLTNDSRIVITGKFCIGLSSAQTALKDCNGARPTFCPAPHLEPGQYTVTQGDQSFPITIVRDLHPE